MIIPERPELMVAYGAAISLESMFENRKRILDTGELLETLRSPSFQAKSGQGEEARPSSPRRRRRLPTPITTITATCCCSAT